MKVKIFKWANIVYLYKDDSIMAKAFETFRTKLEYCDWHTPNDIQKTFRSADTITCKGKKFNRVVFNIGGNKYRLICGYKFGNSKVMLYIRFAGTHEDYDNIKDVCKVNMFD